ncbi:MAG: MBL fold metallo-hydrolase [Nitrospinota bacterium]|nr:MBL fold metallo-hydrolase [Nitrospinota bacterium]
MRRIAALAILCLTLSCATSQGGRTEQPRLLIHFIDVGEGDAIWLCWEGANRKSILVDTGNPITGHRALEYIRKAGADGIDAVIITHPHPDHAGGLFQIAQSLKVGALYDNGDDPWKDGDLNNFYRWYADFARVQPGYRPLKAGDSIPLGEAKLEVIWPPMEGFDTPHMNARSMAVMVTYGVFRALLAADITLSSEKALAGSTTDLAAHILKAGHHAAEDTGSVEFLERVKPAVVVVSVDRNNVNGYPSAKTLERLEATGAKVLRTDRDGDIMIEAGAGGDFSVYLPDSKPGQWESRTRRRSVK